MTFVTDQQTIEDLNLAGKFRAGSLFNLFNRTHTKGGELLLQQFFDHPLTDANAIQSRIDEIKYILNTGLTLTIDRKKVELAAQFLSESKPANLLSSYLFICDNKIRQLLYHAETFHQFELKVQAVGHVIKAAQEVSSQILSAACAGAFSDELTQKISAITEGWSLTFPPEESVYSILQLTHYHHLFLNKFRDRIQKLLELLYQLDAYISIASVAKERNMAFPEIDKSGKIFFDAGNLRHPSMTAGKGNHIRLTSENNLFFLTGANMAGKSTLMKSAGVAFYLSHMGFPVAADKYMFSVMEGIFTSINVPDDIAAGWSHFYSEVMRVKLVAERVSSGKRLLILFDELFKGTNVKDAYDATLQITQKLIGYHTCGFIISTHIIEVADKLKKINNIQFGFMPAIMEGSVPKYTYRLTEGVTRDRHGMLLLQNEGIFKLLGDV